MGFTTETQSTQSLFHYLPLGALRASAVRYSKQFQMSQKAEGVTSVKGREISPRHPTLRPSLLSDFDIRILNLFRWFTGSNIF
jgi:hypothetical protein